jgi:hypothetical protein
MTDSQQPNQLSQPSQLCQPTLATINARLDSEDQLSQECLEWLATVPVIPSWHDIQPDHVYYDTDDKNEGVRRWGDLVIKRTTWMAATQEVEMLFRLQQPPRVERVAHLQAISWDEHYLCFALPAFSCDLEDAIGNIQLDLEQITSDLIAITCELHAKGIIHGDIKPSNLLLDDHHQVYFCDWGISYRCNTLVDQTMYTTYYRPPELWGVTRFKLDERHDIWALGAVLFQLFTTSTYCQLWELGESTLPGWCELPFIRRAHRETMYLLRRMEPPLLGHEHHSGASRNYDDWYQCHFADFPTMQRLPMGVRFLLTGMLAPLRERLTGDHLADVWHTLASIDPVTTSQRPNSSWFVLDLVHPSWVPAQQSGSTRLKMLGFQSLTLDSQPHTFQAGVPVFWSQFTELDQHLSEPWSTQSDQCPLVPLAT